MKSIYFASMLALFVNGCANAPHSETSSGTGTGGDMTTVSTGTSATSSTSSSIGMGGNEASSSGGMGTGGSSALTDAYCASLVVGECGKGLLFDGVCAYVPEPTTKPCSVDGQSATCDGNFACGGADSCLTNSDCPYKQNATWYCAALRDVTSDSPDYHKCKYQPKDDACVMVLTGDHYCWTLVPMAALWLCDGVSTPEAMSGMCSQPNKDAAPNKWCCTQ